MSSLSRCAKASCHQAFASPGARLTALRATRSDSSDRPSDRSLAARLVYSLTSVSSMSRAQAPIRTSNEFRIADATFKAAARQRLRSNHSRRAWGSTFQAHAGPLAQHITPKEFEEHLSGLPQQVKIRLRTAYNTYQSNVGQGLQDCGQLIEEIVKCLAKQAATTSVVNQSTLGKSTALMIDDMYNTQFFKDQRAALGAARSFVKQFRNIVSHPSETPKEMATKLRKCRAGFLEGLRMAKELRDVAGTVGYRVRVL